MVELDRETELAARLAAMEARLAEMEARAADAEGRADARPMDAIDALLDALLPAEVRGHMRAARKEQLLAVRSMVDIWIERVDRKPEDRRRRRHETIQLDED
jgi:hypothetical protein